MVQGIACGQRGKLNRMQAWLSRLPDRFGWYTALLLFAGVLQAASMAWPLDVIWQQGTTLWWLQVLALSVFAWVLVQAGSAIQAAWWAWLFSCTSMCATFWWLFVAMHTYAGLPTWLAAFAVWGLAGPLALYYAAAAAVFWRCAGFRSMGTGLTWVVCLVFAACWTMADMARGIWFTGFGWGVTGYAHVEGALSVLAPWVGVYGVGAVAAAIAMALACVAKSEAQPKSRLGAVAIVMLIVVMPLAGSQWSVSTGMLNVALLQGNIAQDEKFEVGSGVPMALEWYGDRLQKVQADLVVAPETAIPILPQQLPENYWAGLRQRFASDDRAALIGIPLGNLKDGYTNSVIGLSGQHTGVWQYDKHHLVPFGEFIPPFFKWFTEMMNIPLGDFNRGSLGQPSFAVMGQRLAPNICYEDLFGEELAQRFLDASTAPTVFVNFSNMGWFGDNVAIHQHLHISRMRSLEFERPFVRATNTGATVFIDHRAKVGAALPHYTRAVLHGTVEGRSGITPYAWWVARFWLWPLWLLCVAVVFFAWYRLAQAGKAPKRS